MPRATRRSSKTTPRVKDGRVQRKNHRDVDLSRPGPIEIRVDVPGAGYRHVLTRELVERFVAIIPDWGEVSRGLEAIVLAPESLRADGWYRDRVISIAAWYDPIPFSAYPNYHAEHLELWARLGVPSRLAPEFIAAIPYTIGDDELEDAVADELRGSFEVVPGEQSGEWLVVDRGENPGTILADLTLLGDELHLYERVYFMGFDRVTAAAFQLLHVFLHELGHHVDAMTRPHPGVAVRGEGYAEHWANRTADRIWDEALALIRDHWSSRTS